MLIIVFYPGDGMTRKMTHRGGNHFVCQTIPRCQILHRFPFLIIFNYNILCIFFTLINQFFNLSSRALSKYRIHSLRCIKFRIFRDQDFQGTSRFSTDLAYFHAFLAPNPVWTAPAMGSRTNEPM